MLKGKKIALYVSGGIAVYKSISLLRELIKEGAEVRVAMTQSACEFIKPMTFQVLSRHNVHIDTFDEDHPDRVNHIFLADWADYSILAPATTNIIGKLAQGLADDFVSTALLATSHPVFIVPAMNTNMYHHPSVQRNINQLHKDGHVLMEPDTGFLAEGYEGKGRFPELSRIMAEFQAMILASTPNLILKGKKVLVSAGGTVERLDPVRYISNDSSGKMGHALAQAAYESGAKVTLVTASPLPSNPFIKRIEVESAEEMLNALANEYDQTDILFMAAAVSDYAPVHTADQKMKKQDQLTIELKKNPDILQYLGELKKHQVNVGFAAETQNIEEYAKDKLSRKKADFIIANDVSRKDAGFNSDDNEVVIYSETKDPVHLDKTTKTELAKKIINIIAK